MDKKLPLHITEWVFDLDNTIYPASAGIQQQVDARMPDYIMRQFGLDYGAARKLQKDFYHKYGTTLSGLMQEHKVNPYHYWDYIFDIDYAALKHDLALHEILSNLPGRKWVFTNSPQKHAEKVLSSLGIQKYFNGIFDLASGDFVSKPDPKSYRKIADHFAIDPARALMVDDVFRNLVPAAQMGMTTLFLRHGAHQMEYDITIPPEILPYIHFETDDIVLWLEQWLENYRQGS